VREKITIYGNVVKATHGETRKEVLGSGDASKPMQAFVLRQSPLTFVAAPTAAGAASTLELRVNEVKWHETDTLAGLSPDDRKFITKTDDESKTTVVFGNGREGARPPTGTENITAVYRNGIGQPGNVKAGQISLLVTRPLGVKEVINPLPATGGADREGRDQARTNAPLGVLALDRLVSVQDYADFTRTFAGIGKASAVKLSDGAREVIHVTIAGANDIPIDPISDLYKNLVRALRSLGDPHLPIEVELREMLSLIINANVGVLPDYAWEFVEAKIRAALLDAFSFERRELAQDVTKSEVISVIQRVRGVAFVDLDLLASVSESAVEAELIRTTINAGKTPADEEKPGDLPSFSESLVSVKHRVVVEPAHVNLKAIKYSERIAPAQIAVLAPALPETLLLTEVKA
jgi:predicted phage baseplate assembly protein